MITFGLKERIRTKDVFTEMKRRLFFFCQLYILQGNLVSAVMLRQAFPNVIFSIWKIRGPVLCFLPSRILDKTKALESWPIHAAGAGQIDVWYMYPEILALTDETT